MASGINHLLTAYQIKKRRKCLVVFNGVIPERATTTPTRRAILRECNAAKANELVSGCECKMCSAWWESTGIRRSAPAAAQEQG